LRYDIAIIGAGAAGLAAAIFAGAAAAAGSAARIVLLDGAKKPGAKILVSGGGRCNVTHREVRPEDFNGGPQPLIRGVLRAFDHRDTLRWMAGLGVALKLESTGKYFPVSDKARTVLEALLRRVGELGVELRAGEKVVEIDRRDSHFEFRHSLEGETGGDSWFDLQLAGGGVLGARRVIVATGGMALPKSGSDGAGLEWMRRLGHGIIPAVPALCPLVLADEQPSAAAARVRELAGVTVDARLALVEENGRRLGETTDSLLFTHFGLSGPAAMNLSRHWARARDAAPATPPVLALGHPSLPTEERADAWLREQAAAHPRLAVGACLRRLWPERLALLLAGEAADTALNGLTRMRRRALAGALAGLRLRVAGPRGWAFAETTAGGVDLREVDIRTMQSRKAPGLYLCGEILDVDGRIGGFNFQWAWSTGYLAGRGAAASLRG